MPVLRVLLGVLAFACVQPALAQQYWDAAQCEETMVYFADKLEEYVAEMADTRVRLDEAQRKGDAESAANFERILESKRVDGIVSMLKRIDENEYVYCDKSLFDAALIARVDAVRPYAEETQTTVAAVEELPKIAVTGITTTFVPYEMLDGGGCKGPFLDIAINIANMGGDYPRAVDLDRTLREYPTADIAGKPLLNVTLLIDWGSGYGQQVIPVPWSAVETGKFASGATMSVPYRLFVPSDETSVRLGGWVTGSWFFVVDGEAAQSATYETEAFIPMWDVYTHSVAVVTGPDLQDKSILTGAIKAEITNLGETPLPGPVDGSFTVRNAPGAPRLMMVTGQSRGPTEPILAGTTVRQVIKGKTFVESSIFLLCPDGSYGTISDGNTANNIRTLESSG